MKTLPFSVARLELPENGLRFSCHQHHHLQRDEGMQEEEYEQQLLAPDEDVGAVRVLCQLLHAIH